MNEAAARDVLLVCDAFPGHELATLAGEFRAAMADAESRFTVHG